LRPVTFLLLKPLGLSLLRQPFFLPDGISPSRTFAACRRGMYGGRRRNLTPARFDRGKRAVKRHFRLGDDWCQSDIRIGIHSKAGIGAPWHQQPSASSVAATPSPPRARSWLLG